MHVLRILIELDWPSWFRDRQFRDEESTKCGHLHSDKDATYLWHVPRDLMIRSKPRVFASGTMYKKQCQGRSNIM